MNPSKALCETSTCWRSYCAPTLFNKSHCLPDLFIYLTLCQIIPSYCACVFAGQSSNQSVCCWNVRRGEPETVIIRTGKQPPPKKKKIMDCRLGRKYQRSWKLIVRSFTSDVLELVYNIIKATEMPTDNRELDQTLCNSINFHHKSLVKKWFHLSLIKLIFLVIRKT